MMFSQNPYGAAQPSLATIGACFPNACSDDDIYSLVTSVIPKELVAGTGCTQAHTTWRAKDVLGLYVEIMYCNTVLF